MPDMEPGPVAADNRPRSEDYLPTAADLRRPGAIPVDPSTVLEQIQIATARRLSQLPQRGGDRVEQSDEDEGEDEDEDESTFQLWEDKRSITSLLMSSMQKDADTMLVLVFTADNQSYMRSDMSRFDLLLECRKSVSENAVPGSSVLQLGHSRGAMLQLRDIRALQDVHRPSLMVRVGAIVVSIDPLNAIITHDRAFVMVPDGADDLLEPLLRRVRLGHSDAHKPTFEFLALEALLVTLWSHHRQEVQRWQPLEMLRASIVCLAYSCVRI